MKTLEELLKTKVRAEDIHGDEVYITPEFRVSVQKIEKKGVHFIIHPMDHSGDTLDFIVHGDSLYSFG